MAHAMDIDNGSTTEFLEQNSASNSGGLKIIFVDLQQVLLLPPFVAVLVGSMFDFE